MRSLLLVSSDRITSTTDGHFWFTIRLFSLQYRDGDLNRRFPVRGEKSKESCVLCENGVEEGVFMITLEFPLLFHVC